MDPRGLPGRGRHSSTGPGSPQRFRARSENIFLHVKKSSYSAKTLRDMRIRASTVPSVARVPPHRHRYARRHAAARTSFDSLFPADLPEPGHWEDRYPPRELPAGAEVTRFAPSPTGWLHIGGVSTATVDQDVAHHSGGVYLVRIEDTDQARFEEGAASQFQAAFDYFGIGPDEDDEKGGYGSLHPVRTRADLPHLCQGPVAAGQGVPVLRHQGRARRDQRAAEGGRRAARLLRRVGDLAGRSRGAGRAAARRGRPVRGPVPVSGYRRPPGQLHRRGPR